MLLIFLNAHDIFSNLLTRGLVLRQPYLEHTRAVDSFRPQQTKSFRNCSDFTTLLGFSPSRMLSRLLGNSTRVLPGREATTEEPQSGSASSDEIDLVGDQIPEMSDKKSKLQWWDTWALGVSTAIGGHFFLWEICYLAGFGHYIIAYFLIASAYGMLALCMAELTSALPFAGK